MDIVEMLQSEEKAIVDEALPAVGWLEHYGRERDRARERLEVLCRLVEEAVRTRDLEKLLAHARAIAADRYAAGYALDEVRSAFSALEQAIWHHAFGWLPPGEWAWGLSLVGTALEHAREALAGAFASARGARTGFVDMTPVFRGAEETARPRPVEELVHPV
ncbi:MAG TPA: hypothetical protein VLS93_12030 [Anaeromyxobacteraceae bacterium]|nr:hypothetical protein [Anaeromyxobacteraceae bacterium]